MFRLLQKAKHDHVVTLPFFHEKVNDIKFVSQLNSMLRKLLPKVEQDDIPKFYLQFGVQLGNELFTHGAACKIPLVSARAKLHTCNCQKGQAKHLGKGLGHVMTADYSLFEDEHLRKVLSLGPNFRFQYAPNFLKGDDRTGSIKMYLVDRLVPFREFVCAKYGYERPYVSDGLERMGEWLDKELGGLEEAPVSPLQEFKSSKEFWKIDSQNPQRWYEVIPMDKFSDKFVIVCRAWYANALTSTLASNSHTPVTDDLTVPELVKSLTWMLMS